MSYDDDELDDGISSLEADISGLQGLSMFFLGSEGMEALGLATGLEASRLEDELEELRNSRSERSK